MPSLCSRPAAFTVLAAPSEPSSPTNRDEVTNSDRPRTPSGAPVVRARTMWTMLSVRSWSPQVMKIFWPFSFQVPSPAGSAMVRMAPRSEPAWGSVRCMVPVHSPEISLGRNIAFCRSVPCACSASMAAGVRVGHRAKAMLAALTISNTASSSALGRP